jgi:hypothetical protein
MRKRRRPPAILLFAISALPLAFLATEAQAQSSGWVTPPKAMEFSRQMKREKMEPTRIACKGDSSHAIIRDSMSIDLDFSPNTNHKKWVWKWGANFGKVKHDLEAKGWKLTSYSGFTRPKTGLVVRCGIFESP